MKRTNTTSTTLLAVMVVFTSFLFGFSMSALFSPEIVDATFDEASVIPLKQEEDADNAASAIAVYYDATQADWYYDSVAYCVKMGLITGYADGNFYPDAKISRAMIALTLWNIEGYPFVDYEAPFIDVLPNQWYTPAIRWAASIGIIDGCGDGTFRPDNTLSREDLATIAWRYLRYKGVIPEETKDTLDPYEDANTISAYAVLAMRWAHDSGTILGTAETKLSPSSGVTRAQFATFMARYAPMLNFQGSLMRLDHRLVYIEVKNVSWSATYQPGDTFDPTGMVVIGYFADGTTEILDDFTVTPSTDENGMPVIIVESGDVSVVIPQDDGSDTGAGDKKQEETKPTTTLPIGIIGGYTPTPTPTPTNKTLKSVKVTTPPTKTAYVSGEAFDATGMVVTATYTDGSSEAVTGYTVTPTAMVEGVTSVTISYKGFGDTVAVTVGRALESITVTTPPTKTTYNHGDAFDAAGMVVTATYTDGSSEAVTGYTWSPTGTLAIGMSSVTITYEENGISKTTAVSITVDRIALAAIPSQSNTLTYTGSEQSPTWNGYDSAKMTVAGTQTATNAGSYDVTFTPGDNYKWPDGSVTAKTVSWTIGRASVAIPTASGTYTYNSSNQTLTITGFIESMMTKGGTHTAMNAGDYTATISLNDTSNYQWSDGTITAASYPWTINRKTTTLSVNPTSVTLNTANPTGSVAVTTDGDGALSASSNTTSVATASVSGTTVTINNVNKKSGTATITVSQAAGTNYTAASATVSVTATFAPAWTESANGTLVTLGTFKANGTELARPTNPVYNGNIHHYSASETYLFGNTSTTAANNLQWIKLSDTLLVCDRCILDTISWQNIYKNYAAATYDANYNTITTQSSIIGVASGTTITIDGYTYRVRLLTGGATSPGTGSEWDLFNSLCAGDNSKMNWQNMYTWCSETSVGGYSTYRPVRGYGSAAYWGNIFAAANPDANYGFRPALELVSGG